MPSVRSILKRRKRRHFPAQGLRRVGYLGLTAIGLTSFLLGGILFAAARTYEVLLSPLPEVTSLPAQFGVRGTESFRPMLVLDRDNQNLIFQAIHPKAESRRWVHIQEDGSSPLPDYVSEALVSAIDPTFWANSGYTPSDLINALFHTLRGVEDFNARRTLTQTLAEVALLPPETSRVSSAESYLQSAILASRLTRNYSKAEILEWALNSAYFGNWAYGIDGASLVYFDKHAQDLELHEAALLIGLMMNPEVDPFDDLAEARSLRSEVLEAMEEQGAVSSGAVREANRQGLPGQAEGSGSNLLTEPTEHFLWQHIRALLGPSAVHRSGLKVITTLDMDLQRQVVCTLESQLLRLSGEPAGTTVPAADGSACVAAGLLPPIRPGDLGVDHNIGASAAVILDPTSGEVLSMVGDLSAIRPVGPVYLPWIYLTAFSRGNGPGTMILDIPLEGVHPPLNLPTVGGTSAHGPVRMRTALVNAFPSAAYRTLQQAGMENLAITLEQLDLIETRDESPSASAAGGFPGIGESRLMEQVAAYGVLAHQGRRVNLSAPPQDVQAAGGAVLVQSITGTDGRGLYQAQIAEQAVISPQLSYLLVDSLMDVGERAEYYSQTSVLEVGRPAGVLGGTTQDGRDHWVIGFTPQRVVGIWYGSGDRARLNQLEAYNGAAPVWHALIRYASRDMQAVGWVTPPGVAEVEVCDPSGLLPTQYCPQVVQELFLQGTEPTSYDHLYKPFRINRETGKLATLFTPLDLVEERVYLIPPPEAQAWADRQGLEQPPEEYDTLYVEQEGDPEVHITSPEPFQLIHGVYQVLGTVKPEDFLSYRVQAGQGFNPTHWVQIGEAVSDPVEEEVLVAWDTTNLNGLYTLQLLAVLEDGRVKTAAVPVTVDNRPPRVEILSPAPNEGFDLEEQTSAILQVDVEDEYGVARVNFLVDGRSIASLRQSPFTYLWRLPSRTGEYEIQFEVIDQAGNITLSEPVSVTLR